LIKLIAVLKSFQAYSDELDDAAARPDEPAPVPGLAGAVPVEPSMTRQGYASAPSPLALEAGSSGRGCRIVSAHRCMPEMTQDS